MPRRKTINEKTTNIAPLIKTAGFSVLFLVLIMLISCDQGYTPKPKGYFRIDLPEKQYVPFDTTFPYRFDRPVYTRIVHDPYSPDEPYWINLNFPQFKATVHISYKKVSGNLSAYLEDSYTMVTKHIPKADAINTYQVADTSRKVYGLIYRLEGSGTASPYQFFLTDSTANFLRGSLYFNTVPNNDSLAPVIDFIVKDIDHLIETFRWKPEYDHHNKKSVHP